MQEQTIVQEWVSKAINYHHLVLMCKADGDDEGANFWRWNRGYAMRCARSNREFLAR